MTTLGCGHCGRLTCDGAHRIVVKHGANTPAVSLPAGGEKEQATAEETQVCDCGEDDPTLDHSQWEYIAPADVGSGWRSRPPLL